MNCIIYTQIVNSFYAIVHVPWQLNNRVQKNAKSCASIDDEQIKRINYADSDVG